MKRSKQELQALFDTVAEHMMTQCAKSIDQFGNARYRDAEGKMCCVGRLILNAVYEDILEGKSINSPFVRQALRDSGVDVDNPNLFRLLMTLQRAHDFEEVSSWAESLVQIAAQFGLSDAYALNVKLRMQINGEPGGLWRAGKSLRP